MLRYARAAQALLDGPRGARIGQSPRRLVRRDGRTALYRYAAPGRRAAAPPVLVVYALINRPAILDLLPGRSVIEVLLRQGHDVWLLDWGVPTREHGEEGLEAHVLGYLDRAVGTVLAKAGVRRLSLFGYCMGGTLSVMYAALRPAKVARLLAAVAPIRGRQPEGLLHAYARPELFDPAALCKGGLVSAETMNAGFLWLRPVENLLGKYVRYFERADDPEFTGLFFAMERWLSEGVPLPARLYREFVRGVYQDDGLMGKGVLVGKERARAAGVRCPVLVVTSAQDHLVPPSSTKALLKAASTGEKSGLEFAGGHVGLAVSPKALATVWPAAARWLAGRSTAVPALAGAIGFAGLAGGSKDLKPDTRRGV